MKNVFTTICGLLLLSTGCATIVRGGKQTMKFRTDPPHATVTVDGTDYKSPVAVELARKTPHTIIVAAPGHQSIAFNLTAQWDGASLGDIILPGGSVLFGIDTLNGADRNFDKLAVIQLKASNDPSTQPVQMYQYRGQILDEPQYKKEQQDLRDYHAHITE